MNACRDHDNCIVVYEAYTCPVCVMQDELDARITQLEQENDSLRLDNERLKDQISDMSDQIKALE